MIFIHFLCHIRHFQAYLYAVRVTPYSFTIEEFPMRSALMWLVGIPIPIIILYNLFF